MSSLPRQIWHLRQFASQNRLTKLLPGYDHYTSRPVNYIFSTLIQFLELVHDRHLAIFVFVTSELKVAVYSLMASGPA